MHGLIHVNTGDLYPLAGFLVGLLVGLTGVGGGSLMTPLLILLFGVHPVTAVGSDLLQASVTKSVGSLVHGLSGTVEWRITGLLACGSVPASLLTILILSQRTEPAASQLISLLLGVLVIVTALTVLFRGALLRLSSTRPHDKTPRHAAQLTVASGIVLGVLVTLTSVGAGALALAFLYPRLPTARIVAADIAHAVPLTLIAGMGHWWLGTVDWVLIGNLLMGSIPGIVIGSIVATRVPEMVLRPILAAVLLLVGSRLVA
jgi:uncharacterized membrane protein YfcA